MAAGPDIAGVVDAQLQSDIETVARNVSPQFVRTARSAATLGRDAADSLLTADADVRPAALEGAGFVFRHRTVDDAVTDALGPATR